VIASQLNLIMGMLLLAQPQMGEGSIGGIVLNTSRENAPEGSAEVFLQVKIDGEFVAVDRATTDRGGRFLFEGVPLDQGLVYLPGATRDGIHYPGPRILLSADQPRADVVLRVQNAITEPNPLVVRDWDLVLEPQPGALRVTETMVIENPKSKTYVGQIPDGGAEPITLQLGIPSDFERVTFSKEFFGRQFALINGKLVTAVPWTPGRRELQYSYVLRNDERHRVWTRPLDLPCRHVRLTVRTTDPDGVSCTLGTRSSGNDGTVIFESSDRELPAGRTITVELSRLPVSMMAYARWVILALLIVAIAASSLVIKRRRHVKDRTDAGRGLHRPRRKSRAGLMRDGYSRPAR
jgi:hypothetical protein